MIEQTIPTEFLDLAEVQSQHEDELLSKPNVVGVALGTKITDNEDTGEQALTVLVETKVDPDLLSEDDLVPSSVGDVATDVQEVGVIQAGDAMAPSMPPTEVSPEALRVEPAGNGVALREPDMGLRERLEAEIGPQLLATRLRPAMGGYSVGHYRITAGTIATGCYDLRDFPGVPSRYYVLSNNHVIANSNVAAVGDPILQPGPYDGGVYPQDLFARLTRWVPIRFITGSIQPTNYVDAAIGEVPFHYLNREIYWIGYATKMYQAPMVGVVVQKTGRTTNFTTGRVTNINATVLVNYGSGQVAKFARQILAQAAGGRAMGAPGDSGSLVTTLDEEGVGLLFAGSPYITVINHLHYVQALLGVRITER